MPVLAKIADRYVNPLNVTVVEEVDIKRKITEESSNNINQSTTEETTAVAINTVGEDIVTIEGISIEEVVAILNDSLNNGS